MTVLLTGAAGFIASQLAERLLADSCPVVGLDNFDDFYDPAIKEANLTRALDHDAFDLVRGDIRDESALASLPERIDTIVHIAARAGVRPSIAQPALYYDVNVTGTLKLLEFARERGITRFVFASSSSVYGNNEKTPFAEADPVDNPISPYAASKKAGELMSHAYTHLYGITCLCLRFFTVYGPRQRPDLAIHKFTRLMAAGKEIPMFGDGSSRRDYTYIEDILQGVEGALEWVGANPGVNEVVNLGESRTISLREMIDVLGEEMGVEPRIRPLPEQPGDVTRTYADISKARKLLGYDPEWEFREGIKAFLEWFHERRVEVGS
ncbi:MAG: NAD-dependent epimerase/dehydratase family protein [Gemmatimonadetes bacterium]|nr:GDP-mannose 4,6-dehydratase [Gemmatimonadota bacterium]NNM06463.1 NAD-dependent epimerase/dehydratase family protein [Gemmatimonadota bacterium]